MTIRVGPISGSPDLPAGDVPLRRDQARHKRDFLLVRPAPCEDCHRAARCAEEQTACTAFELFVLCANFEKIANASRVDANKQRYERIFSRPPRGRPRRDLLVPEPIDI